MDKYDSNKHYHIGYYEDGYDLEVTAYKRINEPVWDAYIPNYEVDDFYKKVEEMKLGEYIDNYGIMVYSLVMIWMMKKHELFLKMVKKERDCLKIKQKGDCHLIK